MSHDEARQCSELGAGVPSGVRVRRAAVWLFAKQGYSGTGIRDIARESGLTVATLYHHMASKEQLLVDIMCDGQMRLNQLTEAALASVSGPETKLATLVNGLVGTHALNPLSTRVIDSEIRSLTRSAGRERVIELRDEYEAFWADVLRAGTSDQVFDIPSLHATRLALLTMCTGTSNWYRSAADQDPKGLAAHYVDLALGAVRAHRGDRLLRSADVPALDMSIVPVLEYEPRPS